MAVTGSAPPDRSLDAPRRRRTPVLRVPWRARTVPPEPSQDPPPTAPDGPPQVDIAPHDPVLAYLQTHPDPIDLDQIKLDTPGVRALRDAGVELVVPLVSQGELIGLLNLGARLSQQEYTTEDRKLLEHLAGQAAPALRVAQLVREQEAEVRRRERYEQELQVAQLIQQNFLPHALPEPAGWRLDAFYRPAREVGGDFYDVIALPAGELGIVVGDVTDKGVPAALVMASTRSVLRSSASRLVEPAEVLRRVNDVLVEDMPPNMFVTCLYGVLSPDTGRFRFANAGHNLPCVQTADGAIEPRATGMPLGLLAGADYDETDVVIGPGQCAVLYSDALPEAHGPDGEMFGFPRVVEVVADRGRDQHMIDQILTALDRFTGPTWEQEDDITVVTLRRRDGRASEATPSDPTEHATGDVGRVLTRFRVRSVLGNEREAIAKVGDAVRRAGGLDLGPERTAALTTAVGEATMNAIEHGNLADADLFVHVRVAVDDDALVVRIADHAKGGPVPTDVAEPDLDAKLRGDQSPRGWGLFLMESMVDDVRVHTSPERHVVELVMRREDER